MGGLAGGADTSRWKTRSQECSDADIRDQMRRVKEEQNTDKEIEDNKDNLPFLVKGIHAHCIFEGNQRILEKYVKAVIEISPGAAIEALKEERKKSPTSMLRFHKEISKAERNHRERHPEAEKKARKNESYHYLDPIIERAEATDGVRAAAGSLYKKIKAIFTE